MAGGVRVRRTDLTWREIDQQVVLLDLTSSSFFELNRSGSFLWKLLVAEPLSESELAERLATRFGIEKTDADRDVKEFVVALADAGLLESSGPSP